MNQFQREIKINELAEKISLSASARIERDFDAIMRALIDFFIYGCEDDPECMMIDDMTLRFARSLAAPADLNPYVIHELIQDLLLEI